MPSDPQEPKAGSSPTRPGVVGLLAAALCLVTCFVFAEVRHADFVQWDDDINIVRNEHLDGLTAENLHWMFTDVQYVRRYMPLGWLGWAVDFQLFGLTARSCHLGNVAIHSINGVLLFLILLELLPKAMPAGATSGRKTALLAGAAAGALLWAIHPLRVEPVAWASGRIYGLAILFLLISFLAWCRSVKAVPGSNRRRGLFGLSVTAFAASLLTYPLALSYVGVLVVVDILVLRRIQFRRGGLFNAEARKVWLEKTPYAVVVAAVLAVTIWARSQSSGLWEAPVTLGQFGIFPRAMQGFYVWGYYLWKPLLPVDLSPVYTALVWFNPASVAFILSAIMVVGMTTLLVWKWRAWPGLLAVWLCHLSLLVPMLGLTEHPHYTNDRYSYLVSFPFSFVVAGMLIRFWDNAVIRRRMLAGIIGVAAAFSLMSAVQTRAWRDSESLFYHILGKLGDSPYASDIHWRLGQWLASHQRTDEALRHFEAVIVANPRFPDAYLQRGSLLEGQGRWAEAVDNYRNLLRVNPASDRALNQLAWLLATAGDASVRNGGEALTFAKALLLKGESAETLRTLSAALATQGHFAQAAVTASRALGMAANNSALSSSLQNELSLYRAAKPFHQSRPAQP